MSRSTRSISWVWWPVTALWHLLSTIVELTGRFVAMVLGGVLILAGFLISLTLVGAIIGVPLMIVGAMLALKGLF